jgi:hypothetical protein
MLRGVRWAGDFDALRERPFRLLFLAHSASMVGDGFARVALVFAVLEAATAFFNPAATALVPQIVTAPDFIRRTPSGDWLRQQEA